MMKFIFIFLALCVACGAEKTFTRAINSFAFKMYSSLEKKSSNVFFSPASLSVALASTALATEGETLKQISKAMSWGNEDMEDIHKGMQEYLETLRSTKEEATKVRFANRLYADNGVSSTEEFTEKAQKYYGVDLGRLNFVGRTSQSRKQLNDWVKKETDSKIKNFLPDGYLSSDTKLCVANTLYFNGPWLKGFKAKITNMKGKFKKAKSEVFNEIPMMRLEENFNFGDCKKLKANVLEMFYEGRKFSMVIIMPKARVPLRVMENKLIKDGKLYKECLATLNETRVQVFLPRFKFREDFQLKSSLQEMGIKDLFDDSKADLSGLTEQGNLEVFDVYHRAFISVGEKGSRSHSESGNMKKVKTKIFRADHPFMFFIKENVHNSILLMGRVNKPEQKLKSLKKKDRNSGK